MQVVEVRAFGGPDVLHLANHPDPVPAPGELVVRVHAASVNPTDLATRSVPYMPDLKTPFVPGWDLAGVVSAVGETISSYQVGDRVCGMIPFAQINGRVGAYAEAVAVEPTWLAPLPANVSFEAGATLPLNGLTAQRALRFFDLKRGARLLITGASGGVGSFAVQLAVRRGLHVVGVADHDDEAWVAALGAAEVLPRDADLDVIAPVDGVLDTVPLGPNRSTPALRDGGTAVFTRQAQPSQSDRVQFKVVFVENNPTVLAEMAQMLGAGLLRTRVARVLPLAQAAEAHRLAEAGGLKGKVVLSPGQGEREG